MEKYENKYCAIINRFTKKILVAGIVVNHKSTPIQCISFDNKYFFNIQKSFLYKIIILDKELIIPFNPKNHKITLWRYVYQYKNKFIYREFDKSELDEEIKDLVHVLNDLGYETSGSCCGHAERKAYVDIRFKTFSQLSFLLSIINTDKFRSKFYLTTEERLYPIKNDILFALRTYKDNEQTYTDLKELTDYLIIIKEARA